MPWRTRLSLWRLAVLNVVQPVYLDITADDIAVARLLPPVMRNCPGYVAARRQWPNERFLGVGRHLVTVGVQNYEGDDIAVFTRRWDIFREAEPTRIRLHRLAGDGF